MDDREAGAALVRDLRWQITQLRPRGVKNTAGNPYVPSSRYKRGLDDAVPHGSEAVVEHVRGYLYKPPNGGCKKLGDADALDLACEWLVADADKPYAHLFTERDREAARSRLAPHIKAIGDRRSARRARIEARRARLPADVPQLRALAAAAVGPEDAVAINSRILERTPSDVVALNRLGRAYESLREFESAADVFRQALDVDPGNAIAKRRLRDIERRVG